MQHITSEAISGYDKHYRTNLINSLTGFKSISLIGSFNREGKTNLAIFSQIIHVGANPPLIGILFRPHTVVRHTLENILDTGEFTVNHIHESFVREAHHTSARWEESEFEACNLEAEYHQNIGAPYVKNARVKLGCTFAERQNIQVNNTVFIVGEIKEIFLEEGILKNDGFVDLEEAGTVCCSGLDSYHTTQRIARYSYAKPDRMPEEI